MSIGEQAHIPPELDFDTFRRYDAHNPPAVLEQNYFFHYALLESEDVAAKERVKKGAHYGDFERLLAVIRERLQGISPDLPSSAIMPGSYQPTPVQDMCDSLPEDKKRILARLRQERLQMVGELAENRLWPALASQTIPDQLLDIPPYCWQGQDWDDGYASRTCVNACFRMLFGGIVGWVPNEETLAGQMKDKRGDVVVPDEEYFRIFATESFSKICSRQVRTIELLGADFDQIAQLGEMCKSKLPNSLVYCMVNLGSAAVEGAWHANVLLGMQDDSVICHDPSNFPVPSGYSGAAHKAINKHEFVRRWAAAYNRAQMVIAA